MESRQLDRGNLDSTLSPILALQAGILFGKGYRATRLWGVEEEGAFATLERCSQGPILKRTPPRTFGAVDPHFRECRGVVLSDREGEEVKRESDSRLDFSCFH